MTKVITYGTFDLLHFGHENLLRAARALGDYLIVGVTSEDFDRSRGKLLVQQSLAERMAAVKATGLVDEVIVEEYEGQKIDDIKRYGVDIFTVGSDWKGKFDYLSPFCKVVYLSRTEGVSSTELRSKGRSMSLGVVGVSASLHKFVEESRYISGCEITHLFTDGDALEWQLPESVSLSDSYEDLLSSVDAVYVNTSPERRYTYSKIALEKGVHVLSETPVALTAKEAEELYALAKEKGVIFCEGLKTAYSLAFQRMVLLLRGGAIGSVKSVEATCTSLAPAHSPWLFDPSRGGGALAEWGSYVIYAALSLLGNKPESIRYITSGKEDGVDLYTKLLMLYPKAEATLKAGIGVKSEGELIISGTKGYIYVPAPWWKMDYFEVRKEDIRLNRKYFYPFEGEGIRYELAEFIKGIQSGSRAGLLAEEDSIAIAGIMEEFLSGKGTISKI